MFRIKNENIINRENIVIDSFDSFVWTFLFDFYWTQLYRDSGELLIENEEINNI